MKYKWRLFESYFTKAGQYSFGDGDTKMAFNVGVDRVFEIEGPAKFPLYTIAEAVRYAPPL